MEVGNESGLGNIHYNILDCMVDMPICGILYRYMLLGRSILVFYDYGYDVDLLHVYRIICRIAYGDMKMTTEGRLGDMIDLAMFLCVFAIPIGLCCWAEVSWYVTVAVVIWICCLGRAVEI